MVFFLSLQNKFYKSFSHFLSTKQSIKNTLFFIIIIYGAIPSLAKSDLSLTKNFSTLEENIGQFFIIGLTGTKVSTQMKKTLRRIKPGGIILYNQNFESVTQLKKFIEELQSLSLEYSQQALIICLDQEGGLVSRLKTEPPLPSALSIGLSEDLSLAKNFGYQTGLYLNTIGVNTNLAPVLDVLPLVKPSFMGSRSFGFNPDLVGKMGKAYAEGLLSAKVLPTAKHFPGLGSILNDPHQGAVRQSASKKIIFDTNITPFRYFFDLYPSATMLSHVSYPSMDESGLPASLSKKIITQLLKEKLNYKGLIITDDLLMSSANFNKSFSTNIRLSLSAGADMVMVSSSLNTYPVIFNSLLNSIKNGDLSSSLMEEKFLKIKNIKSFLSVQRTPLSKLAHINRNISELEETLLKQTISKNLVNIDFSRSRFVVVDNDQRFRWYFERGLNQPVGYISKNHFFDKSYSSNLSTKNSLDRKTYYLFPIKKTTEINFINQLPEKIKSNSIILNMSSPNLISGNFSKVILLHHEFPEAAYFLGKEIAKRSSTY